MSKDMILVGQIERSNTQLGPPRPVQVVKTFCISPPCSDAAMSRFRLQWADRKCLETVYLPASATANEIKDAIESNLANHVRRIHKTSVECLHPHAGVRCLRHVVACMRGDRRAKLSQPNTREGSHF